MSVTYTTTGDVRGDCGHAHRSIDAAQRCIDADEAGCAQQGGYGDREIHTTECVGNTGCDCECGADRAAAEMAQHEEMMAEQERRDAEDAAWSEIEAARDPCPTAAEADAAEYRQLMAQACEHLGQ